MMRSACLQGGEVSDEPEGQKNMVSTALMFQVKPIDLYVYYHWPGDGVGVKLFVSVFIKMSHSKSNQKSVLSDWRHNCKATLSCNP